MTLENVMLDSVRFVDKIKNTTKGITQETPVIIVGSSYGGFLSPVIRLNYPETFYGAVAWASPIRCFGPDKANPDRFIWMDHVSNVYYDQSANAAKKIKNALHELDTKIANPATLPHTLASELSLCSAPTNHSEFRDLMSWLVGSYQDVTQYSLASALVFDDPDVLPNLIRQTEAASSTSTVLNAVIRTKAASGQNCTDYASAGAATSLVDIDSYGALLCKYYTQVGGAEISNSTIFPTSVAQSYEENFSLCPTAYNVSFTSMPTQAELQKKYRFIQADIEASQRILFPMGEWDPVGAIGPKPFNFAGTTKYTDRMASRAWVVNMMSHGEDSLAPVANEKPSVVHARQLELQSIKEWLNV